MLHAGIVSPADPWPDSLEYLGYGLAPEINAPEIDAPEIDAPEIDAPGVEAGDAAAPPRVDVRQVRTEVAVYGEEVVEASKTVNVAGVQARLTDMVGEKHKAARMRPRFMTARCRGRINVTWIYACMIYIYVYIHIYIHIYIYMRVCVYTYICI